MKLSEHPFHILGANPELVKRFRNDPPTLQAVIKALSKSQKVRLHTDRDSDAARSQFDSIISASDQIETEADFLKYLDAYWKIRPVMRESQASAALQNTTREYENRLRTMSQIVESVLKGTFGIDSHELNLLTNDTPLSLLLRNEQAEQFSIRLSPNGAITKTPLKVHREKDLEALKLLTNENWLLTPMKGLNGQLNPMPQFGFAYLHPIASPENLENMKIIGSIPVLKKEVMEKTLPSLGAAKGRQETHTTLSQGFDLEEFIPLMKGFSPSIDNGKSLVAVTHNDGELKFHVLGTIQGIKDLSDQAK